MVSDIITLNVDGKDVEVEVRKLKWKEQKEVMRKSMETRMIGTGEVAGKIDLVSMTDETMKRAVVRVKYKDENKVIEGIKNIGEWIDNLDEDVATILMNAVMEMNSFLQGR